MAEWDKSIYTMTEAFSIEDINSSALNGDSAN